eukprot:7280806-Pyramimonas_sp.AAC.1
MGEYVALLRVQSSDGWFAKRWQNNTVNNLWLRRSRFNTPSKQKVVLRPSRTSYNFLKDADPNAVVPLEHLLLLT